MMRFEGDEPAVKGLNDCIAALREAVDFDVPKIVPVAAIHSYAPKNGGCKC